MRGNIPIMKIQKDNSNNSNMFIKLIIADKVLCILSTKELVSAKAVLLFLYIGSTVLF